MDVGIIGLDRLERPPDFRGRVGLHVESVDLAGRAKVEDQDAGFVVLPGSGSAERLQRCKFRETQANSAERADLQEVAASDAVAGGD